MALPELQDGAQSRQKAEYVGHTLSRRGKSDYIELTYKRLDGPNPGVESKTGNFVTALDEASRDLIKAKGTFVVVKTKDGKFWPLTKVEDVSTFVEKKPYTGGGGGFNKSSGGGAFNNAGIKVGAVLHDAVALFSAAYEDIKHNGSPMTQIRVVAEELLTLSYELEANVRAGKYEPSLAVKASVGAVPIVKNPTITGKVSDFVEQEDSFDNIDF